MHAQINRHLQCLFVKLSITTFQQLKRNVNEKIAYEDRSDLADSRSDFVVKVRMQDLTILWFPGCLENSLELAVFLSLANRVFDTVQDILLRRAIGVHIF
jgi:hypothetical protein